MLLSLTRFVVVLAFHHAERRRILVCQIILNMIFHVCQRETEGRRRATFYELRVTLKLV